MKFDSRKGFTILELLVVVAIIGILSTVVLVSVSNSRAKARDSRRMSDMKAMQGAIELAKATNPNLPQSYGSIGSTLNGTLVPNYIVAIPSDPAPGNLPDVTYYYCNVNSMTSGNYCHNDTDTSTYAIAFFTEKKTVSCPGNTGNWQTSLCCLTSSGIYPAETGNVTGLHCTQR